jgi:hypothetical protein
VLNYQCCEKRQKEDLPFFCIHQISVFDKNTEHPRVKREKEAMPVTEGANFIFPIAFCQSERLRLLFYESIKCPLFEGEERWFYCHW